MPLRMRNVAHKSCTENQTRAAGSITFLFFENRALDEIMWKNVVEPDRPRMTIWRMRNACCITKATNTHSEYVVLIAFPLQQRLDERASKLRYTYSTLTVWKIYWCCFLLLLTTAAFR
jgi:hypothetical protein